MIIETILFCGAVAHILIGYYVIAPAVRKRSTGDEIWLFNEPLFIAFTWLPCIIVGAFLTLFGYVNDED